MSPNSTRVLMAGIVSSLFVASALSGASSTARSKKLRVNRIHPGVGARYACGAVFDPSSRLFLIFGGQSNEASSGSGAPGKTYGDLRAFRPGKAKSGWTTVPAQGEAPSARSYPAMVLDSRHERLWVFGGFDASFHFLDDLWTYSLKTQRWRQVERKNGQPWPQARDAAGLIFDQRGGALWLFGGLAGFQPMKVLGDLWRLDLEKGTWSQPRANAPAKERPGPRFLAGFVSIDKKNALLMGGHAPAAAGQVPVLADCWRLDLSAGGWHRCAPLPAARYAAACLWDPAVDAALVIHGQDGSDKDQDTVFAYVPGKDRWANLGHTGNARSYMAAACDPHSGVIYLTGGVVGGFGGRHPEDVLLEVHLGKP